MSDLMDVTTNREYPYPVCDPPLVKDESNAPVQTRLLAETIHDDLDTVSALVADTYQLPTAIIRLTAATSTASNGTSSSTPPNTTPKAG
jgi:hypothetical protein